MNRCGLCDKIFVDVKAWENHMSEIHPFVEALRMEMMNQIHPIKHEGELDESLP